jgi:GxxExxY protein
MNIEKYKHKLLTKKIIGCGIEVHKELGPGFLESIYHKALIEEFLIKNINHETEKEVKISYKNKQIGIHKIDLYVENKIVVELKAVTEISDVHISQVVSYLKATGQTVGLILNFAKSTLDIKRVILN